MVEFNIKKMYLLMHVLIFIIILMYLNSTKKKNDATFFKFFCVLKNRNQYSYFLRIKLIINNHAYTISITCYSETLEFNKYSEFDSIHFDLIRIEKFGRANRKFKSFTVISSQSYAIPSRINIEIYKRFGTHV